MSYELSVKLKGLSDQVIPDWLAELNKFNMKVEVHPGFSFDRHSGFLPFKIVVYDCPNKALNHIELVSGFDMFIGSVDPKSKSSDFLKKLFGIKQQQLSPKEVKLEEADTEVIFAISVKDSFEFRMCWYSAASLALLCDGVLTDLQEEIQLEGQQLLSHALKVVREDEGTIGEDEWIVHKFEEWKE